MWMGILEREKKKYVTNDDLEFPINVRYQTIDPRKHQSKINAEKLPLWISFSSYKHNQI